MPALGSGRFFCEPLGTIRYNFTSCLVISTKTIVSSEAVTICILNLVSNVGDQQRVDAYPDPTFYVAEPNPDATLKLGQQ